MASDAGVRLTYCGNVHPAADLDEWLGAVERYAVPVAAAARAAGAEFGLGVHWPAALAAELRRDRAAHERLQSALEQHALPVWTANAFPFGDFHAERVKTAVYRPDWATPERVAYTLDVARLAAALAPERRTLPISTLPLGYGAGDRAAMADRLRDVAGALERLERCDVVLALEPEPFCLCETVVETVRFLEEEVFRGAGDEALLRRRLGVCVDLCHLAVVREDPVAAFELLRARGVRLGKVQVSSGLELRDAAALERLLAFDEPRYLHQTVAADGTRALDLDAVAAQRAEFARAGPLVTHFHVPVFWDAEGALGSTGRGIARALAALPEPLPLLEVETYTWGVLGASWAPDRDLARGLVRELEHVRRLLAARPVGGGDSSVS